MIDFCYKLARKSMPKFIYQAIRKSRIGRLKCWESIDTHRNVFFKYDEALKANGSSFVGKTVLEVGGGAQIYTALYMLANGCQKVFLAEPNLKTFDNYECISHSISVFKANEPTFSMAEEDIMKRIVLCRDLTEISCEHNSKTDAVFSHLVLEHFDDLNIFFSSVKKLLASDGLSFNIVDLSDHTYHIFECFKILAPLSSNNRLRHLRYSKRMFSFINDGKCFMNRFLVPLYRQKSGNHGFDCQISSKETLSKTPEIHKDIICALPVYDENDLNTVMFEIVLKHKKEGLK
jgi:SAM-dependent methyltransferase